MASQTVHPSIQDYFCRIAGVNACWNSSVGTALSTLSFGPLGAIQVVREASEHDLATLHGGPLVLLARVGQIIEVDGLAIAINPRADQAKAVEVSA